MTRRRSQTRPPTDVRLRWYLKWPTSSIMGYESGRDSRERCTNGVSPPGARPGGQIYSTVEANEADLHMSTVDTKGSPCPTWTCFEQWVGRAGKILR